MSETPDTKPTFMDRFKDPVEFAATATRLASLSRYADNAATSVLAGSIGDDEVAPFTARLRTLYASLRDQLVAGLDDELAAASDVAMVALDDTAGLLESALVIDQAHAWVTNLLNRDAIAHQLRVVGDRIDQERNAHEQQKRNPIVAPLPGQYV